MLSPRIVFFGIRRSGNHAIQEWIASHYWLDTTLFNDMKLPLRKQWFRLDSKRRILAGNGPADGEPRILSFEDYAPVMPIKAEHYVAVIRDPYNCFASRLTCDGALLQDRLKNFWESVDNWKQYVNLPEPWITINYNRWVYDIPYREAIPIWGSSRLPKKQHRSSFNDAGYCNRWRQVRPCDEWTDLLQRDDIRELAQRVFGWHLTKEGRYATHL